jgi:hypothetical protein
MSVIVVSLGMKDRVEFLYRKAEQLRVMAGGAPEIAEKLRRLAEDLEARAAELSQEPRTEH